MNDLKVEQCMTHLVVSFKSDEPINEAARRLAQNAISGGPVVEDGKVIGMLSEADVISALVPPVRTDRGPSILDYISMITKMRLPVHEHGLTVGDVMNPKAITVQPDASIWEAASLIEHRGVKRLPVVDGDDTLLGIVSRADLVRVMAREDREIKREVEHCAEVLGPENFEDLNVSVDDGVVTLRGGTDRRSTKDILVRMSSRVPGAVEVVDHLIADFDDTHARHERSIDPRLNWTADTHAKEEVRP